MHISSTLSPAPSPGISALSPGTRLTAGSTTGPDTDSAFSPHARPQVRRTHLTWSVFGELNRDWDSAYQHAPLPHRWSSTHPALVGIDTLGELLEGLSGFSHAAGNDAVLHALLELNRAGEQLAGRAVLQAMLGKVCRLAWTARKHGCCDPHQSAITAMWTSIGTYPLRRHNSVAGNLALDALRLLTREAQSDLTALPHPGTDWDRWDDAEARPIVEPDAAGRSGSIVEDPEQILRWALEQHVISDTDHVLLSRLYLTSPDNPKNLRFLATELGISDAAVRKRHSRAMQALLQAVRTRLLPEIT